MSKGQKPEPTLPRISYKHVSVEYAYNLKKEIGLVMEGFLSYLGQRAVRKDNERFVISDFQLRDSTGAILLKVFGPVPANYFPYRNIENRVRLINVTAQPYKGDVELVLPRNGRISILKQRSTQSLLKFLASGTRNMKGKA